jgi:hypothetical protein
LVPRRFAGPELEIEIFPAIPDPALRHRAAPVIEIMVLLAMLPREFLQTRSGYGNIIGISVSYSLLPEDVEALFRMMTRP